jgi:hypothetical protein
VACVAEGDLGTAALAARLEHALRQAGLTEPQVSVGRAEAIPRDAQTVRSGASSRGQASRPGRRRGLLRESGEDHQVAEAVHPVRWQLRVGARLIG